MPTAEPIRRVLGTAKPPPKRHPYRRTVRAEPSSDVLTARQRAVAELLAAGAIDDAIARALRISGRTVRSDVAAIMSAFDAGSRFQAGVRYAGWRAAQPPWMQR